MNTFTSYTAMPETWQFGFGIVIALIAIYAMRKHSKGYTTAVVVIGVAIPSYSHNFPVMAAAIMLSLFIAMFTLCVRTRKS